jgi:hypothetical protein
MEAADVLGSSERMLRYADGQYVGWGPDKDGQVRQLRTADGINFTSAGPAVVDKPGVLTPISKAN